MTHSLPTTILGVMSGTSLDGIDIAACQFWEDNDQLHYRILAAHTYAYQQQEKERLKRAFHLPASELLAEHSRFGDFIGEKVLLFCKEQAIQANYIASHGHTLFHQPEQGFTFQLGHAAHIAARSGIPTIADFRSTDVAYGGQGAPLVPIGDELLFSNYAYCLNLGGISNISYTEEGKRRAFDIGICNMMLNELANELNLPFDKDGAAAQRGTLNEPLLRQLADVYKEHYHRQSLGYEWYVNYLAPIVQQSTLSTVDKLRTACEFIALQIAQEIKHKGDVLVSGGGAHNTFLRQCLSQRVAAKIIMPPDLIVNFKEALIFALLGWLRLHHKVNALAKVTGAIKDNTGGGIYLP